MGTGLNPAHPPALVDWAIASSTLVGQSESGDRHVVKTSTNSTLLAVVDGLGHGEEAAHAAKTAVRVMEQAVPDESLLVQIQSCHRALKETRGVVMTLVSVSILDHTLTWLGVGNVNAVLLHQNAKANINTETIVLRGGVVGYEMPNLRAVVLPVVPGDLILIATDGIRGGFEQGVLFSDKVQAIADRIMAQHSIKTDDALILVARYVGRPS